MARRLVDVPRTLDALGIQYRIHGDELWAPCPHPDHHETRPSWSIANNPVQGHGHGLHFCFGCQFTGNAIGLVQAALGGVSYHHAMNWITEKGLWLSGAVPLNIEVETRGMRASRLRIPKGLRGGPLEKWVTPVRRYISSRGVSPEQIMRWGIMYATDGDMGGRVVFPVRDEWNEWISFHARTYCDQDKRYKNASNDDGYDAGAIFGQQHWPAVGERKECTLAVTEGAIDALAVERAGADFIGALGGSDPHARQWLRLGSWGRIICVTDGDRAGDKLAATVKANLGRNVEVLRAPVPKGEDAQSIGDKKLKEVWCAVA